MKRYIVYKHTSPSGKSYIGITCQPPSERWRHGEGYADNPYFYEAIKKYGWDAFTHEILLDSLTQEAAEEAEIRLIREYRSAEREHGYNIAPGGSMTSPAAETRQKMSEAQTRIWQDEQKRTALSAAMRGLKRSEEARANISVAQKKRFERQAERDRISERQKGGHRTEEAKAKTSASLREYYSNPENREAHRKIHAECTRKSHAKKVRCVDTGEVFEAVKDAGQKYGIDPRNICAVCGGKRKRAGDRRWEYA